MLLLVGLSHRLRRVGRLWPTTEQGIVFRSQMYVPIVVAVAAPQNVAGALGSRVVAVSAGASTVLLGLLIVMTIVRMETKRA